MSTTMRFLATSSTAAAVLCLAAGACWGAENLRKTPFGKTAEGQTIDL